jgi:eukaryotic-like serine/threonine-protein kinase
VAELPLTEEGARTEVVGDGPTNEEPAHRTPDESTEGLAASDRTTQVPASGQGDVSPLDIGETLAGRFTVLRFIARGGMGAVYEASDLLLRTRVALKVIGGHLARDATAMERFHREVVLARRVSHPNVCRVHDLYETSTASGAPIDFLTMELIEGEPLARRLKRTGRMSTEEALPLARQMCAGLAAAHAEGIVHRDFKSSNVMLVPRGESTSVTITDFGVARALSAASTDEKLTGDAGILGTPEYMAPEQVTGGQVTPATDIYALGVVLYEMVTGELPFVGDTRLATAARRLHEAPPRPDAPGLDAPWKDTIVRCLAREPNRRFRNALDVSDALVGEVRRWRRPRAAAVLALFALVGALTAAWTLPWVQGWRTRRSSTVVAPRPVAAILGIASGLLSNQLPWVPTAVEEMLHRELAAAETSLRVLTTDKVADARRSLGVTAENLADEHARSRLQGLLGANRLIHGEVVPAEPGSDLLQLRLHVRDGPTGKEQGLFVEELGQGAEKLPEALIQVGGRLREAFHAPLTAEEQTALSASRVKSLDAAHTYAEGVTSFRACDYTKARDSFEAALAHDSTLVDAQWRIARSWRLQGYGKNAMEAFERLASQKQLLTPRRAAEHAALALYLGPDAQKGLDARIALFNDRPDDEESGVQLAWESYPKVKLALVTRLKQLPRPVSDDLWLNVVEAQGVSPTDLARAHGLIDQVEGRARELGARSEEAWAHRMRGALLFKNQRGLDAIPEVRKALALFSEVGDLRETAGAATQLAVLLLSAGTTRDGLAANAEAVAAWRRLGNRAPLESLLSNIAILALFAGDAEMAKKRLDEARSETELLGDSPGPMYFSTRFKVLMANADLTGARSILQEWRKVSSRDESLFLPYEAGILREQDRAEEARVSLRRFVEAAQQQGQAGWVAGNTAEECSVQCVEGHVAEGLACLTALPRRGDGNHDLDVLLAGAEAECNYRAKDFPAAEAAARRALAASLRDPDDFLGRLESSIALARIVAASGRSARGIEDLRAALAEIRSRHSYKRLEFAATLALGEAELMAGIAGGRVRLIRLEHEAKGREFFHTARLAREALGQVPQIRKGVKSAARSH